MLAPVFVACFHDEQGYLGRPGLDQRSDLNTADCQIFNSAAHHLSRVQTLRVLTGIFQETEVMISQGFASRIAWPM